MTPARLVAAAIFVVSAWALPAEQAGAQNFPARNITVIVPYAAGGPTDLVARQLAPLLTSRLGQNIVVENVSGGGTNIATARVANAAPDGYTLLLHNLQISANVTLYPKLAGETERQLVPIAFINTNPLVLIGRKTLAANTLPELIAWMKSTQSKIAYPGVGSTGHLTTALTLQTIGARGDLVPYRGAAPALQDIVGGHADLFYATPQQVVGVIRDGTVKAFGVTAKEPLKQLPALPSLVQALGPKLEVQFWQALFAPAATPAPVLDKLNAALREAMRDPALLKSWDDTGVLGFADEYHTLAGAKALFHAEVERWGEVVRVNKIEGQN
jgi:tripartite-type tricarboxylate transporter receptor subunit TctC